MVSVSQSVSVFWPPILLLLLLSSTLLERLIRLAKQPATTSQSNHWPSPKTKKPKKIKGKQSHLSVSSWFECRDSWGPKKPKSKIKSKNHHPPKLHSSFIWSNSNGSFPSLFACSGDIARYHFVGAVIKFQFHPGPSFGLMTLGLNEMGISVTPKSHCMLFPVVMHILSATTLPLVIRAWTIP